MASTDHAFFYNSDNGDRVYDADSFEHLLKKFFTTGVFQGSCKGSAPGTGMTIRMGTGYCNIDGKVRFFSEQQEFLLQNAHATYDRIDTLVIERNDVDRDITAKVVTGSYSSSPRATAPVRSGGIYQLVVAEIYVAGGVVRITNSNVTDKRPDTSVCGYVLSAVQTPDFSELYAQFESQADDVISEYTGQFDHWYQVSTADFQEWFEEIRGQLDEDQAGHLQNEVDTLAGDISNAYDDSATYSVGNYCIRGNVLYKCIVPITSPESWTAAHWQAVNISDELAAEKSERAAADASQSQAIANVEDGLAIVANGNTHAAVASGQFVYVKNHSTLADGLYRATAAIATNGALSTSNLAADASGGLNALKASVDSLNSNVAALNSNVNRTSDILTDALNCTGTKFFYGIGSSYTGSVPANSYKYGTFIVNVRGTDRMVIAQAQNNGFAVNVYTGSAWLGWKILLEIGDLTNIVKIVATTGQISESDLAAGAYGYITASFTIPSGYKTTGIVTVNVNHPGTAGGLSLTGSINSNATGNQTAYLSYYSPRAISAANADYTLNVLCIRSDFAIT